MSVVGLQINASEYRPQRSVIAPPEPTTSGNVVLRVGRELPGGPGWEQTEYVVLTASEARAFAVSILAVSHA
jgi:hypothetical protein